MMDEKPLPAKRLEHATTKLQDASMSALRVLAAVLFLGCAGEPPPTPKPPCGLLGDSCAAATPCCRSVNRAPIECLAGVCEYR